MGAYSLTLLPAGTTIPGIITLRKRHPDLERDLSMQALLPMLDELDRLSSENLGREFFGKPVSRGFAGGEKPRYHGG